MCIYIYISHVRIFFNHTHTHSHAQTHTHTHTHTQTHTHSDVREWDLSKTSATVSNNEDYRPTRHKTNPHMNESHTHTHTHTYIHTHTHTHTYTHIHTHTHTHRAVPVNGTCRRRLRLPPTDPLQLQQRSVAQNFPSCWYTN